MAKIAIKPLSANAKKVIILCSMVALLVITGVLNFVLTRTLDNEDSVSGEPTEATFFSAYRSDRETSRAEEFSYLDAIIASADSTDEIKATATAKKMELLSNIDCELVVENLIKAKGFEDAVVTMSTNNINVIVQQEELTSEQVAQILSVILSETDYTPSQVVIVPYKV
ncbi:MAG: SpoIIIAH-like family protein [Christensenellales bacterium]